MQLNIIIIMNTLPPELILTIFDNLSIPDKRVFIRISKTYNNITKQSMSKVKFIIFIPEHDTNWNLYYVFWCVCDTLIDFKRCLMEYLDTKYMKGYEIIFKRDNFKPQGPRFNHEFIIEDTIINVPDKILDSKVIDKIEK